MEFTSIFKIVSICTGIVAVLFIILGLSLRGWVVIEGAMPTGPDTQLKGSTSVGLWEITMCTEGATSMCLTMSKSEFVDKLSEPLSQSFPAGLSELGVTGLSTSALPASVIDDAVDVMYGDSESMKILMSGGLLCAVCGLVFMCVYFFRSSPFPNADMGVAAMSTVSWGLACILVICAVSAQAMQNSTIGSAIHISQTMMASMPINIQMQLPWALVLCGFGSFFSAVTQLLFGVFVCRGNKAGDNPRDWHEFSNQNQAA